MIAWVLAAAVAATPTVDEAKHAAAACGLSEHQVEAISDCEGCLRRFDALPGAIGVRTSERGNGRGGTGATTYLLLYRDPPRAVGLEVHFGAGSVWMDAVPFARLDSPMRAAERRALLEWAGYRAASAASTQDAARFAPLAHRFETREVSADEDVAVRVSEAGRFRWRRSRIRPPRTSWAPMTAERAEHLDPAPRGFERIDPAYEVFFGQRVTRTATHAAGRYRVEVFDNQTRNTYCAVALHDPRRGRAAWAFQFHSGGGGVRFFGTYRGRLWFSARGAWQDGPRLIVIDPRRARVWRIDFDVRRMLVGFEPGPSGITLRVGDMDEARHHFPWSELVKALP